MQITDPYTMEIESGAHRVRLSAKDDSGGYLAYTDYDLDIVSGSHTKLEGPFVADYVAETTEEVILTIASFEYYYILTDSDGTETYYTITDGINETTEEGESSVTYISIDGVVAETSDIEYSTTVTSNTDHELIVYSNNLNGITIAYHSETFNVSEDYTIDSLSLDYAEVTSVDELTEALNDTTKTVTHICTGDEFTIDSEIDVSQGCNRIYIGSNTTVDGLILNVSGEYSILDITGMGYESSYLNNSEIYLTDSSNEFTVSSLTVEPSLLDSSSIGATIDISDVEFRYFDRKYNLASEVSTIVSFYDEYDISSIAERFAPLKVYGADSVIMRACLYYDEEYGTVTTPQLIRYTDEEFISTYYSSTATEEYYPVDYLGNYLYMESVGKVILTDLYGTKVASSVIIPYFKSVDTVDIDGVNIAEMTFVDVGTVNISSSILFNSYVLGGNYTFSYCTILPYESLPIPTLLEGYLYLDPSTIDDYSSAIVTMDRLFLLAKSFSSGLLIVNGKVAEDSDFTLSTTFSSCTTTEDGNSLISYLEPPSFIYLTDDNGNTSIFGFNSSDPSYTPDDSWVLYDEPYWAMYYTEIVGPYMSSTVNSDKYSEYLELFGTNSPQSLKYVETESVTNLGSTYYTCTDYLYLDINDVTYYVGAEYGDTDVDTVFDELPDDSTDCIYLKYSDGTFDKETVPYLITTLSELDSVNVINNTSEDVIWYQSVIDTSELGGNEYTVSGNLLVNTVSVTDVEELEAVVSSNDFEYVFISDTLDGTISSEVEYSDESDLKYNTYSEGVYIYTVSELTTVGHKILKGDGTEITNILFYQESPNYLIELEYLTLIHYASLFNPDSYGAINVKECLISVVGIIGSTLLDSEYRSFIDTSNGVNIEINDSLLDSSICTEGDLTVSGSTLIGSYQSPNITISGNQLDEDKALTYSLSSDVCTLISNNIDISGIDYTDNYISNYSYSVITISPLDDTGASVNIHDCDSIASLSYLPWLTCSGDNVEFTMDSVNIRKDELNRKSNVISFYLEDSSVNISNSNLYLDYTSLPTPVTTGYVLYSDTIYFSGKDTSFNIESTTIEDTSYLGGYLCLCPEGSSTITSSDVTIPYGLDSSDINGTDVLCASIGSEDTGDEYLIPMIWNESMPSITMLLKDSSPSIDLTGIEYESDEYGSTLFIAYSNSTFCAEDIESMDIQINESGYYLGESEDYPSSLIYVGDYISKVVYNIPYVTNPLTLEVSSDEEDTTAISIYTERIDPDTGIDLSGYSNTIDYSNYEFAIYSRVSISSSDWLLNSDDDDVGDDEG